MPNSGRTICTLAELRYKPAKLRQTKRMLRQPFVIAFRRDSPDYCNSIDTDPLCSTSTLLARYGRQSMIEPQTGPEDSPSSPDQKPGNIPDEIPIVNPHDPQSPGEPQLEPTIPQLDPEPVTPPRGGARYTVAHLRARRALCLRSRHFRPPARAFRRPEVMR